MMSVDFDSFDQSPLGMFIESPLGARNSPGKAGYVFEKLAGTNHYVIDTWTVRSASQDIIESGTGFSFGGNGYVCGGGYKAPPGPLFDAVDRYTPASDSWIPRKPLPTPARRDLAGVAIGSAGYVFGGDRPPVDPEEFTIAVDDCDKYIEDGSALGIWIVQEPVPLPRRSRHSVFAADSRSGVRSAYISGGWNDDGFSATLIDDHDQFLPASEGWSARTPVPPPNRRGHSAGAIGEFGYIFGGSRFGSPDRHDEVDRYSANANSWAEDTPLPSPTTLTATFMLNGSLFITGRWAYPLPFPEAGPHSTLEFRLGTYTLRAETLGNFIDHVGLAI